MLTFMQGKLQCKHLLPLYPVFIMGVSFLFLNIRSLPQHKLLFEQLLLEEKIHTFLLNETHLKQTHTMKVGGYKLLRQDSQMKMKRANGGVAIGFFPNIAFRHFKPPFLHLPEYLITTLYYKDFYVTVATIYVRPGHVIPLSFFQYISTNFRTYIIMADINLHSRPDRHKTRFANFIADHTTAIIHPIPAPTRPISNTTPDVVITSANISGQCAIQVLDLLGSDHAPIKLVITSRLHSQPPAPIVRTTPRFDKADWVKYRELLTTSLAEHLPLETEEDLYSNLELLHTALLSASSQCIPVSTQRPYRPALPPQYLPLIRRSRTFYRDYARTGNAESLRLHRQFQRMVQQYVKAYKLRQWVKTCNTLADTTPPTTYWRRFNSLTGKYSQAHYPLLDNDHPVHDDTDKANVFATTLQTTFTPPPMGRLPRHHPALRINLNSPHLQPNAAHSLSATNVLTEPIQVSEIASIVARKRSTAPGLDQITYRHVKEAPYNVLFFLSLLYNFILRTGFFPTIWKTSKTLMFPKPNKPTEHPSSYRPIQLTPTFSKIFEKILVNRLHTHLHRHRSLPIFQAGFRPGYNVNDPLLRLSNIITNHYNLAHPSCLILFDLEKAFDKVWHRGLMFKLLTLKLPIAYLRLIYAFLSNRIAYVYIHNSCSHPIFIHCGVPQGSALSPLLYLLYVADFPPVPDNVHVFQYADDTALLATAKTMHQINRTLHAAIHSFAEWCRTWHLTINAAKTQAIVFLPPKRRSKVHRNPARLSLTVQGVRISPTKTVKYLGITFDSHLTWRPHLKELAKKARRRLNLLKRLTGTTWGPRPDTILNTYKVFLRPLLTFGFTAWISAASYFYDHLKVFERHALRIAYRIQLPSPTRELYDRLTFPYILEHIEALRIKFIRKKLDTNQLLFLDTIDVHLNYKPRHILVQPPLSLLFTLYRYTLPPDHPDLRLANHLSIAHPPPFLAPSFTAQ